MDPTTYKVFDSFKWRVGVLNDVIKALEGHENSYRELLEETRLRIVNSGLPEEYRIYAWYMWHEPLGIFIKEAKKLQPDLIALPKLHRDLFAFLYVNRKRYEIQGDGVVSFTDKHSYEMYNLMQGSHSDGSYYNERLNKNCEFDENIEPAPLFSKEYLCKAVVP